MIDRLPAHQSTKTPTSAPTTITASVAKSKKNPYAKPGVGKCYRVENLGTSPMNALRESKSIWQITKMSERERSRLRI